MMVAEGANGRGVLLVVEGLAQPQVLVPHLAPHLALRKPRNEISFC